MTQTVSHRWLRKAAVLAASAALALAAAVVTVTPAHAEIDVYSADGEYYVNGRQWLTTCDPYSQTQRCRTSIWATQVTQVNGKFVSKTGWYFNNLTYLPSPRSLWRNNPLGAYGQVNGTAQWKAADGRQWRTVCDIAATGRGGCRSYASARVIEPYRTAGGVTAYRWVTKEVFNNIVRFGTLPVFKTVVMDATVSLKYFDVTVSNPVHEPDGTGVGAMVKVCYTHAHPDAGSDGKVRVSLDPWSFGVLDLEAGESDLGYFEAGAVPSSTLWTPLYKETRLALGTCNSGNISAHHGNPDLALAFALRYAPSGSADRITWYSPNQ